MMTGFERYTKKTRRAIFLEEMEQVVPWAKLCALIEPHYPKAGNGRRPKELEKMLRIYVGHYRARPDCRAVREHSAGGPAALDDDFTHR